MASRRTQSYSFYEFFAGGGMARAGLGTGWRCLFANDIDEKKAASYKSNWGGEDLRVCDVRDVEPSDLPGIADLSWASFPCQDLSLAGNREGLNGDRSGTFWPFWNLMQGLIDEGRAPRLIVLENVCGALTSHSGKDFAAISGVLSNAGYQFGAVVIDAVFFLPQSRPRLFVIAAKQEVEGVSSDLIDVKPMALWHSPALMAAHERLPKRVKANWVWWRLPIPSARQNKLVDILEENPLGVAWHSTAETDRLLSLMTPAHLAKVETARRASGIKVGTVYKRTRCDGTGRKQQRAEVRFDDVAGCLRTSRGGSSRQTIIIVKEKKVRSRLLSPREAARLMGLSDSYRLPETYNDSYTLAGDGLVVPVVRFLAQHIFEPALRQLTKNLRRAA